MSWCYYLSVHVQLTCSGTWTGTCLGTWTHSSRGTCAKNVYWCLAKLSGISTCVHSSFSCCLGTCLQETGGALGDPYSSFITKYFVSSSQNVSVSPELGEPLGCRNCPAGWALLEGILQRAMFSDPCPDDARTHRMCPPRGPRGSRTRPRRGRPGRRPPRTRSRTWSRTWSRMKSRTSGRTRFCTRSWSLSGTHCHTRSEVKQRSYLTRHFQRL